MPKERWVLGDGRSKVETRTAGQPPIRSGGSRVRFMSPSKCLACGGFSVVAQIHIYDIYTLAYDA